MEYWLLKKYFLLRDKSNVFRVRLHYEMKSHSYSVPEARTFLNLECLDEESPFIEIMWVIYNLLRRTTIMYRSKKNK